MAADALGDTPQYITSPQIVTVNSPGFTPLLIAPASRIQGFQERPENFASFTYRKPGMNVVGWQMLPLNNPGEIVLASQKTFLIVRVGGFDGFNLAISDTDGNPLENGVGFVFLVDDTNPFNQKVIVNAVGNKDGLLQIFNEDGRLAASIYLQVFAKRTVLVQHHILMDNPPAIGRSYLTSNGVSPSCESLLNRLWSSQTNIEFKLTGDTDTILVDVDFQFVIDAVVLMNKVIALRDGTSLTALSPKHICWFWGTMNLSGANAGNTALGFTQSPGQENISLMVRGGLPPAAVMAHEMGHALGLLDEIGGQPGAAANAPTNNNLMFFSAVGGIQLNIDQIIKTNNPQTAFRF